MRSGLILYIVGATLFVATGYVLANRSTLEMLIGGILMYSAVVFVLVLFGVTAIIFGYSQRPKNPRLQSTRSSASVNYLTELTRVKGIGEKRAEQLQALGITALTDLSVASATELAEKLQISPKITNRWIENARNLLLEKQG